MIDDREKAESDNLSDTLATNQSFSSSKAISYAKKHAHIELICQHIMRLDEFEELFEAYQNDAPRETVRERYQAFLEHYFSEDSETELRKEFSDRFKILLSTLYSLL